MKHGILLFFLILPYSLTLYAQTYYIVRHAEKSNNDSASMMSSNPPLSSAGKERAKALKHALKKKDIKYIFSTNTIRSVSTAEPLSRVDHIDIQYYGPKPDSAFIRQLRNVQGNALIVGHSNTVDDIVNALCGKQILNDLPDAAYDNLFVVTKEDGQFIFRQEKYGKTTSVRTSKKRGKE
jgi:phosphohistidine phosphatase SixA